MSVKLSQPISSEEAILRCRVVMVSRGMRRGDLARLANVPVARISNLLCGNDVSWPIREKVNRALNENIFQKSI